MGRGRTARALIVELSTRIEIAKQRKKELVNYLQRLEEQYRRQEISYSFYVETSYKKQNNKTIHEWIEYYEDYIRDCEKEIKKQRRKLIARNIPIYFFSLIFIVFLLSSVFQIAPTFIGFLIQEPTQEFTETLNLQFNQSETYEWLPKNLGTLNSLKISGSVDGKGNVKIYLDDFLILDNSNINSNVGITGGVISETEVDYSLFEYTIGLFQKTFSVITGRAAEEIPEETQETLEEPVEEIIEDIPAEETEQETNTQEEASQTQEDSTLSQIEEPSSSEEIETTEEIPEELEVEAEAEEEVVEENVTEEQANETEITENITEIIKTNITEIPEPETEQPSIPEKEIPKEAPEFVNQFIDICEETCNLEGLNLNKTSYTLRIEISNPNTKLNIDEIKYELFTETLEVVEEIPENITIIPENITEIIPIENVTGANATIQTTQFQAVLGKPVKWKKDIQLDKEGIVKVKLPKDAKNISVFKLTKELREELEEKNESFSEETIEEVLQEDFSPSQEPASEPESGTSSGLEEPLPEETPTEVSEQTPTQTETTEELEQKIEELEKSLEEFEQQLEEIKRQTTKEKQKAKFTITAQIISEKEKGFFLFEFFKNTFGAVTGLVVDIQEKVEEIEVTIEDNATSYEIEYETPAPYAIEEDIDRGKRVKIVGPEDIHYKDVLVFTNLSESFNIKNPNSVKIHWIENNTFLPTQQVLDLNSNGIYDYVSWIAPSLSNQTFDIIVITKAEHLDSNSNFISDIFEEVKELDGVWSETIPNQDYVRVTFEIPLDSSKDITLYPRIISGNPRMEIYEVGSDSMIAEFTSLNDNEYNKVFLTNLQGEQDTFDLLVLDGSIEIDHIIDPQEEKFFEVCSGGAITDQWVIEGGAGGNIWQYGSGGNSNRCWSEQQSIENNMTLINPIDLSAGDITYANLSFTRNCDNLDAGSDYLKAWVNSSSESWILLLDTANNDEVNEDFNLSAEGLSMTTGVYIRFSTLQSSNNEDCWVDDINVTAFTDPFPQWFDNQTNDTTAGAYILHSVNWTDNDALSGYIFSFDNGTGTFTNDSFVEMTGTNNWSNVSKIVNSTKGSTIRWQVYANDSANKLNATDILTYNTTWYGTLNVNLTLPIDPKSVTVNNTFTINATVNCVGDPEDLCGTVYALARYNLSGSTPDTAISITEGATPFYVVSEGWNLSSATYDNVNISTQETFPTGLFFKSDGTRLYEIGTTGDLIYQYSLSDAWNLSSATYDNVNISTQDGVSTGLFFKSDGTRLYEIGQGSDLFYQYSCSDAWNLSSCSYDNINIPTQNSFPEGLFFKSDGTRMYEIGFNSDLIHQYSLSDAWNLSSATYDNINIPTQNSVSTGLFFKSDGTKLYETGYNTGDLIYQSTCSDAWNLSSCTYDNVNISTQDSTSMDLFFKSDGTRLYEIGFDGDLIYQYSLSESSPNPKTSPEILEQGGSWNVSWTINTSQINISEVDVFFNSSYGNSNVFDNDTGDSTVDVILAVDSDPPTFSNNQTNTTVAGAAVNFSVLYNDNSALNPNGQYVFSTNNTGTWVNDSVINFTTTPEWANITKTLNSTVGTVVGYQWYANDSAGNTNNTGIFTLTVTSGATAPTITFVEVITSKNPTDDTITSITFNFTATDDQGAADLDPSTAIGYFQRTGEATRSNASCIELSTSGNDANYSCTIDMWYFDQNGAWTINVTIKDDGGLYGENSSTTFTYNILPGMKMSPTALTWDNIEISETNIGSNNDPITINNTGNDESVSINITAYDLRGLTITTQYIYAANISVGNAADGCSGTAMLNATSLNVTSAILERGNHSLNYNNATSGQEQLFFCVTAVNSDIEPQSYSSSAYGNWEIRILLVAIIPRWRKKKKQKEKVKKRKKVEDDRLLDTLGIIMDELKEKYNLGKSEIMNILIKEMRKKYKLTRKEILELSEVKKMSIPITIFSKELGALETIIKYMKENLNMNYKEIAKELGRDERTIWTAYKKAKEKMKESFKIKDTKILLPILAFENKELTILESIIIYLKEKGMKYSEIAELLDRDQRNIWTIYSRAVKKLNIGK